MALVPEEAQGRNRQRRAKQEERKQSDVDKRQDDVVSQANKEMKMTREYNNQQNRST
jgi:hypothetical protein